MTSNLMLKNFYCLGLFLTLYFDENNKFENQFVIKHKNVTIIRALHTKIMLQ